MTVIPDAAKWRRRSIVREEIDLEKCNFRNYRSPLTLTLTLDRVNRQGHINTHNTYKSTSKLDHVTVASSYMEIWPFEFCIISTFRDV